MPQLFYLKLKVEDYESNFENVGHHTPHHPQVLCDLWMYIDENETGRFPNNSIRICVS